MIGAMLMAFLQRRCSTIRRRLLPVACDSTAAFLLEALIAASIFMTVAATALIGASATQRARGVIDRSATAENVARNQMEQIFSQAYQTTTALYSAVTAPSDYSVTAAQQTLDATTDLQKIIVTVFKDNESILVLETLRRNR